MAEQLDLADGDRSFDDEYRQPVHDKSLRLAPNRFCGGNKKLELNDPSFSPRHCEELATKCQSNFALEDEANGIKKGG